MFSGISSTSQSTTSQQPLQQSTSLSHNPLASTFSHNQTLTAGSSAPPQSSSPSLSTYSQGTPPLQQTSTPPQAMRSTPLQPSMSETRKQATQPSAGFSPQTSMLSSDARKVGATPNMLGTSQTHGQSETSRVISFKSTPPPTSSTSFTGYHPPSATAPSQKKATASSLSAADLDLLSGTLSGNKPSQATGTGRSSQGMGITQPLSIQQSWGGGGGGSIAKPDSSIGQQPTKNVGPSIFSGLNVTTATSSSMLHSSHRGQQPSLSSMATTTNTGGPPLHHQGHMTGLTNQALAAQGSMGAPLVPTPMSGNQSMSASTSATGWSCDIKGGAQNFGPGSQLASGSVQSGNWMTPQSGGSTQSGNWMSTQPSGGSATQFGNLMAPQTGGSAQSGNWMAPQKNITSQPPTAASLMMQTGPLLSAHSQPPPSTASDNPFADFLS